MSTLRDDEILTQGTAAVGAGTRAQMDADADDQDADDADATDASDQADAADDADAVDPDTGPADSGG
jgi:hypothetical protein